LGLVNLSNLTMRRGLRALGRRWAGYLLKLWDDAAANGPECYMRWPGERMPPPEPPRGGPRRDRRPDDWELAA
jgi:hypothetical protein